MTGFFSRIQSLFPEKYSGRYFSLLLRELAFQEPEAFARVFDLCADHRKALSKHNFQLEWEFEGLKGNKRRADLALLIGGKPILLVEIKEDDVNNPSNQEQLSDYLYQIDEVTIGTRFVHLSRYPPTLDDKETLAQARAKGLSVQSLRYRNIYEKLKRNEDRAKNKSAMANMLLDYLEDIGVWSYQVIDLVKERRELTYFLIQALGFPDRHGLGKLHSQKAADAIPEILSRLFKNLGVIGEWVRGKNPTLFAQPFARKFLPRPSYDLKALRKKIPEGATEEDWIPGSPGQFIKSGTVYFFTYGKIKSTDWLYIECGFGLEIEKGAQGPVEVELYVNFYGKGLKSDRIYTSKRVAKFPAEDEAYKNFATLMGKARAEAIKADDGGRYHDSLGAFQTHG
jgi:hypothetical protein